MTTDTPRVRARVRGERPGPTLIALGAVHGNEPAGLEAAARLVERLSGVPLAGELVVLAGNRGALAAKQRQLAHDLNRAWTSTRLAELAQARGAGRVLEHEDRELDELDRELTTLVEGARGPVYLADLHTSSAAGIPFMLVGEQGADLDLMRRFQLPVILGLLEQVTGVLTVHWATRGVRCFSVEGGQHDDPASREALEAVLWLTLDAAGMVDAPGEVAAAAALLAARRGALPQLLEVRDRHAITAEDAFVMEPGFRNLEPVEAGRLLAHDRRGPIRAPEDGVVVLPLYQKIGSDGFFWARALTPAR
jgi:predicted deacylase